LRVSTLRLVSAAVKDRDIAARAEDRCEGIGESEILSLLSKMVKQRKESAQTYEENGRPELAEREREEIDIIQEFMPQPLSEDGYGQSRCSRESPSLQLIILVQEFI